MCFRDPSFEVDLFVSADLRALVAVYFGRARLEEEIGAEHIRLMGSRALARSIGNWLILSSYAVNGEGAGERVRNRDTAGSGTGIADQE